MFKRSYSFRFGISVVCILLLPFFWVHPAHAAAIPITNLPVSGGSIIDYEITSDGSRVVYHGNLTNLSRNELFSASTKAAGTQIKLNDMPPVGGNVMAFGVSPDGSRVAYSGGLTIATDFEIYSASTSATGTQIKLNNTFAPGDISLSNGFRFSPDSNRLVFRGSMTTPGVLDLYGASPTAAGTQVALNNTPVTGGNVGVYSFTPDGSRVIFEGDLSQDGFVELYSVSPTASGTQVKLTNTPVSGGDVSDFKLTPDGTRVIYLGDLTTNGEFELYSASTTTAGTQIKLSNTPVTGGDVEDVNGYMLTPDGSRVVYRGDLNVDNEYNLYGASTTSSGTQIQLNNTPVSGGDVRSDSWKLTPDGSRVIYRGDLDTDSLVELYSASTTAAGTQIKLNSAISAGSVEGFVVTPDGSRVVYHGSLNDFNYRELFSASTTAAGTQIQLSDSLDAFGFVQDDYKVTSDGSLVVYRGDLTTGTVTDLYSASTSAAGTQVNLSQLGSLSTFDVASFSISPNNLWVAYILNSATESELWLAKLDGSNKFEADSSTTLDFENISWLPDNSGVVFEHTALGDIQSLNFAAIPEPRYIGVLLGVLALLFTLRFRERVH